MQTKPLIDDFYHLQIPLNRISDSFQGGQFSFQGVAGYYTTAANNEVIIHVRVSGSITASGLRYEVVDHTQEIGRFSAVEFYGLSGKTLGAFDTIGMINTVSENPPGDNDDHQYSPAGRTDVCTTNGVVKQWNFYSRTGLLRVSFWSVSANVT